MSSMVFVLVVAALVGLGIGWFVLQIRALKAALVAYQDHRPVDAERLARRCLSLRPLEAIRPLALQVFGLAVAAQGRTTEAEKAYREALASTNPAYQARSAVLLAALAHRDGRLQEARELLLRGRAELSVRRDAGVGLIELAINEGDFELAHRELAEVRALPPLPEPEGARQAQGLLDLLGALLELEQDHSPAARKLLEESGPKVASIPVLAFRVDVARALVSAMETGQAAIRALGEIEQRLTVCGDDRTSRLAAELLVARGYLHARAYPEAERLLRAALLTDPPRVAQPEIHFLLADCARARGDAQAEREALERAAAVGIATRHAGLARRRLAEGQAEAED